MSDETTASGLTRQSAIPPKLKGHNDIIRIEIYRNGSLYSSLTVPSQKDEWRTFKKMVETMIAEREVIATETAASGGAGRV